MDQKHHQKKMKPKCSPWLNPELPNMHSWKREKKIPTSNILQDIFAKRNTENSMYYISREDGA
jgi:hypothetical protein